ncbi:MAG: zinc-ribbon domain-containing protein [Candidatus Saliniplasma sp.]
MTVDPIWFLIIVIITLIGFSAAILLYLEKTKDKRVANIRKSSRLDKEDEAYNKVKSTKSIINVMKRSGKNTSDAEVTIDRAEIALQSGNYSKATSLAEEAKSKLERDTTVKGGSEKTLLKNSRANNKEEDPKMKKAYTLDEIESLESKEGSEEFKAKSEELRKQKEKIQNLPENYLESKFEIQQATDMLEREGGGVEAEKLLEKAKLSFDNEEYTEALRLSLKCKKAVDEDKAGLIKFRKIGKKETESKGESGGSTEKNVKRDTVIKKIEEDMEESTTEEKHLSKESVKCPDCGYTGTMGDNFCPKCGTEMVKTLSCPSCGREVKDDDNFCPGCGYELSPSAYECPDCGAEVDEDVKFCPKCGIEFE